LDFRVQQKEKAAGDHTIKNSTEEVRILYCGTLNWDGWKAGSERCNHPG
jgi:hypothetical protein